MSTNFTREINDRNIQNIKSQIAKKKSHIPFFATQDMATQVLTDYDVFPYTRWYRGVPEETRPVIAEREAGWRQKHNSCYNVLIPNIETEDSYPNHCFEGPCSTVYPCYPKYMQKFSDREAMNVMLNRACIAQYR